MIPVTLGLHALGPNKSHGPSFNLKLGVIAQISLVVASALLFTGAVSDMLYMAPIGLVGLWLLRFNRAGNALCSPALAWSGRIAGVGLCAIGLGFVIYGLTVAPAVFIRPLTPAEIDAQALTPGNLVAHILMLVGTLIGRLVYPFWTIALGQRLMKLQE